MVGINELTVNFGERYLFNKISFIINDSDRIGLVGKNGAGKSTLLNILGMLDVADKGTYTLDTVPIKDLDETKAAKYR
ncbi:MAG: ATP-binding cassette domain-containing protein, partial [Flavobacteriales bacterium]|nr:ATP-binding cassette domain-containing protein [Flavobacteriales bacterium]